VDQFVDVIVNTALATYRERAVGGVHQVIQEASFGRPGISICYQEELPSDLPAVQAHAIREPLKVRMITKGDPRSWILKPVQRAMWKALGRYPCFSLTHGQDIDLSVLDLSKPYLVSGDYTAATDNLHMDLMQEAISIIAKAIPDIQIRPWMLWEAGIHRLTYPSKTGISDCLQTSGQLMGSLLSFPILCLANITTVGLAMGIENLEDIPALVNGDDILFASHQRTCNSWKRIASSMGLYPSIGKNYVSTKWGSINSQLILRNKKEWHIHPTGKFRCLVRSADESVTAAQAIRVFGRPLVVRYCKKQLERTPASIDLPEMFGGLGPNEDISSVSHATLLDREIYFFRRLSGIQKVTEVDDKILIRLPKNLYFRYRGILELGRENEPLDEEIFCPMESGETPLFPWREFNRFKKWYKTVPQLSRRVLTAKLLNEVPLSLNKGYTLWISKTQEPFIENLRIRV
jgi:hypothetical protein